MSATSAPHATTGYVGISGDMILPVHTFSLDDIPNPTNTPWRTPPIAQGVAGDVLGIPSCSIGDGPYRCGEPDYELSGQEVNLLSPSGDVVSKAITDRNGQFAIPSEPGSYMLVVRLRPDQSVVHHCSHRDVKVLAGRVTSAPLHCITD